MAVIYIRGPYSAPTEAERLANVERACEAAVEVIRRGDAPIVPHLSHYIQATSARVGAPLTYETWMRVDFELLRKCDAVLSIGDGPGSLREAAFALGARIPGWGSLKEYCRDRDTQGGDSHGR